MKRNIGLSRRLRPLFASALLTAALGAISAGESTTPSPLAWDAMEKASVVHAGETMAEFVFTAANRGAAEVVVTEIESSCGCTVVNLPARPWRLSPGESGVLRVSVDFTGKRGELVRSLLVRSTAGEQRLVMKLSIQPGAAAEREQNQKVALADRQAVFRGDCARCHAAPAAGKFHARLYETACAICHASTQRASVVPDLMRPAFRRDAEFWQRIIAEGRPNTLMPAFARQNGGPPTDEQIRSLVEYAIAVFPAEHADVAPPAK